MARAAELGRDAEATISKAKIIACHAIPNSRLQTEGGLAFAFPACDLKTVWFGRADMDGRIAARLQDLGLTLPLAQPPVASYLPYVRTGNLLFVSGQLPMVSGKLGWVGKLGHEVSLEEGRKAARQCFLNVLAHMYNACSGDLDIIARVVRLGGFIACGADFLQHAQVMNGASDLAFEVFGEAGRHARATVGVPSLPLDAPVEVEGLFELIS